MLPVFQVRLHLALKRKWNEELRQLISTLPKELSTLAGQNLITKLEAYTSNSDKSDDEIKPEKISRIISLIRAISFLLASIKKSFSLMKERFYRDNKYDVPAEKEVVYYQ